MASMMITHHVIDFVSWKTAFDSNFNFRRINGELSAQIFRDESAPNKVTVVMQWTSLASAHEFAQSPDWKTALAKTGVIGKPEITFVTEA